MRNVGLDQTAGTRDRPDRCRQVEMRPEGQVGTRAADFVLDLAFSWPQNLPSAMTSVSSMHLLQTLIHLYTLLPYVQQLSAVLKTLYPPSNNSWPENGK